MSNPEENVDTLDVLKKVLINQCLDLVRALVDGDVYQQPLARIAANMLAMKEKHPEEFDDEEMENFYLDHVSYLRSKGILTAADMVKMFYGKEKPPEEAEAPKPDVKLEQTA